MQNVQTPQPTYHHNKKAVDFLDLTLDLRSGIYKRYKKPNNNIAYFHKQSSHPPCIIKNLPKGTNKRLSTSSNDTQTFKEAISPYIEGLKKSGYNAHLKFDTASTKKSNDNKTRKWKISWFDLSLPPPPFFSHHQFGHQCCQNIPLFDRQTLPQEQQIGKKYSTKTP